MEMDVKNDLPAAVVDVHHQAIATVSDVTLTRQPIRHKRDCTDPYDVIGLDVQEGWNVPLRHDQEVDRGTGMKILNGQQDVIFVDFDGWLSVIDDIAKHTFSHQTIHCGRSSLTAGLRVTVRLLAILGHRVTQLLLRVFVAQLAHDSERLLIMGHGPFGVPHLCIQATQVT